MKEFSRVFGRKNWCILLLLCFMNIGVFFFCADAGKDITLTGEQQQAYLEEYPQFLDRTVEQGQKMISLGLFQSGFSREQMQRITGMYQSLQGISVLPGDNRGLVLWLQYRVGDVLLLFYMGCLVYDLQAERRKGLQYMVRSTAGGRGKLFFTRSLVLLAGSLQGVFFLHGSSLLCTKLTMGLEGLDRTLQSLPEFMRCPYQLTIRQFIGQLLLLKIAGAFLAAFLFYLMLGSFSKALAYGLPLFAVCLEAALFLLIPGVSSLRVLKYANLWAVVFSDCFCYDALFFSLFGHCVDALFLIRVMTAVILSAALVAGAILHSCCYTKEFHVGEKLLDRIFAVKERFALSRTLFGWEFYKLYLRQGALLLLAAAVAVQIGLSLRYEYYYPINAMEKLYYLKYQGEIDEACIEKADRELQILKNAEQRYRNIMEELSKQEVFHAEHYGEAEGKLWENLETQKGFLPVYEEIQAGYEYAQKTGRSVWLVEPFSYDLLINRDEQTRNRASFLEFLVILTAVGGVYALEKQNRMSGTIRTSYLGRRAMLLYKPILVVGFCCLTCLLLHGVQLFHISESMGFPNLTVAVQSLTILRDFPLDVTISGYLMLTFLYRMFAASVLGLLIAMFGSLWKDRFMAMGAGAAVLIVLFAVSLLGETNLLNPIYLLGKWC